MVSPTFPYSAKTRGPIHPSIEAAEPLAADTQRPSHEVHSHNLCLPLRFFCPYPTHSPQPPTLPGRASDTPSAAAPTLLSTNLAQPSRWTVTIPDPLASSWFWVQAGPITSNVHLLSPFRHPARPRWDGSRHTRLGTNSLSVTLIPPPYLSIPHAPHPHAKPFGLVRFLPSAGSRREASAALGVGGGGGT